MKIKMLAIILLILYGCKKDSSGSSSGNNNNGTGGPTSNPPAPGRQIVIADQSQNRVMIVDISTKSTTWEWKPSAMGLNAAWFSNMSDAKPVYNKQYILATASGGGVALVRIADKKALFYAYTGNGNTHSAELLPDGNIVTASSTGGYLMLFKTDTTTHPYGGYTKKVMQDDAHNVVWDKKRQLLWSASNNKLYAYRYNFNCAAPDLTLADSIALPASGSHELFSDYGKDSLLLSTSSKVWTVSLQTRTVTQISAFPRIKSVSPGPSPDYYTIVLQAIDTNNQWWNDNIMDLNSNIVFQQAGLKMYKVRWLLDNAFSYTGGSITLCQ